MVLARNCNYEYVTTKKVTFEKCNKMNANVALVIKVFKIDLVSLSTTNPSIL